MNEDSQNVQLYSFLSNFDNSSNFLAIEGTSVIIYQTNDLDVLCEFSLPQKATQAFSFDEDQKILVLWEDGIARIFDPNEEEPEDQIMSQFIGHRKSVTSGWISLDESTLATGGKDIQTIIWDIETQKKLKTHKYEGKSVIDMNWFTNNNYQFMEISEDCNLRLFDIRSDIKVTHNVQLGKDCPSNLDIDDTWEYFVTGHRTNQSTGNSVKLWDIRKLGDKVFRPIATYEHKSPVVSAKFYYIPTNTREYKYIVSASLDGTLKLSNAKNKSSVSLNLIFL